MHFPGRRRSRVTPPPTLTTVRTSRVDGPTACPRRKAHAHGAFELLLELRSPRWGTFPRGEPAADAVVLSTSSGKGGKGGGGDAGGADADGGGGGALQAPRPARAMERMASSSSAMLTVALPAGEVGLNNLGNTCYINATLQVRAASGAEETRERERERER